MVKNGAESESGEIEVGVPQGSVLRPLLFLIYINDLENGIKSLFSIVHDADLTADDLNHNLNICEWSFKMSFNPDLNKQAVEVIFSHKTGQQNIHKIYFNNVELKRVPEQKHLGLILDLKLSFVRHINEKISIAHQGISEVPCTLFVKTLDQIYKMYVRPHLDFCDLIYDIPVVPPGSANEQGSSLILPAAITISLFYYATIIREG